MYFIIISLFLYNKVIKIKPQIVNYINYLFWKKQILKTSINQLSQKKYSNLKINFILKIICTMEELNTAELTHNNILQIQETINSSNIISSSHKETNQSLFSISSCFEKYKLVITKLIPYESFIHRFFLIDLFSLLIFFDQSFSNINPIIKIMYFVILALVDLNLIYRLYKGNALYSNATLIYKIAFSYITMFCIPTSDLFTYINFLLFHTSLMIMLLILVSLIIITQNTSYLYKDWKRYSLSFINIVILIYIFCSKNKNIQ